MKRLAAAAMVGLVVGMGIWAAVNSVPSWPPWGFWGFFFGVPAAIATFGVTLMVLARDARRMYTIGRWVAVVTLLMFGLLICFGPYGAFSQPVFSLEWLWLFPLGITPLIVAGWLIVSPRRKLRPGVWDAPPRASQASD